MAAYTTYGVYVVVSCKWKEPNCKIET